MIDSYYEKCVCGAEIGTEITPDTVDWVQIWTEKHRNCRQIYAPPTLNAPYSDPIPSRFFAKIRAKILENEGKSCG